MSAELDVLPLRPLPATDISRTILKMAWPVVIERLSISVLSAVDAALVGHYVGANGLAAVGIGALMFWIPLSGALAVDVGSTAVVARDIGAGDNTRVQTALHTAVIAALVWGLICTAFVFALAPQLMRAMGAEPEVVPLGVEYLRAGSLGFPMLMALYAVLPMLAWLGVGNLVSVLFPVPAKPLLVRWKERFKAAPTARGLAHLALPYALLPVVDRTSQIPRSVLRAFPRHSRTAPLMGLLLMLTGLLVWFGGTLSARWAARRDLGMPWQPAEESDG